MSLQTLQLNLENSILKWSSSVLCRNSLTSAEERRSCRGVYRDFTMHFVARTHYPCRKLTKRVEDLTQESGALKSLLIPQLQALNNVVPELVNFGISVRMISFKEIYQLYLTMQPQQLAQQVMPHLSDVRSSKSAFQLTAVLGFVKQIAASTVGKGRADGVSSWDAVSAVVASIMQDAGKLLPLAMETENVIKSA